MSIQVPPNQVGDFIAEFLRTRLDFREDAILGATDLWVRLNEFCDKLGVQAPSEEDFDAVAHSVLVQNRACTHGSWPDVGLGWKGAEFKKEPTRFSFKISTLKDSLNEFIESCCTVTPVGHIPKSEFYRQYARWSEDTYGAVSRTMKWVNVRMEELGFTSDNVAGLGRVWKGIRMNPLLTCADDGTRLTNQIETDENQAHEAFLIEEEIALNLEVHITKLKELWAAYRMLSKGTDPRALILKDGNTRHILSIGLFSSPQEIAEALQIDIMDEIHIQSEKVFDILGKSA